MNLKNEYLSDEQLQKLVQQVEMEELILAPPDLKEDILKAVANRKRDKKKEYRQYCFHVFLSAAAAIMLLFLLPELKNIPILEEVKNWKEQKSSEESWVDDIPTKEEALEQNEMIFEKWHIFSIINGFQMKE